LKNIINLFAETEVFIYVFVEIITKLDFFKSIIAKKAKWHHKAVFVLLFGGFSIFGTYVGIPLSSGAISNIRDLAPMIAGLVAGPIIGLFVGLIGGIHRFFLGGITAIPCGISTILAGLICGGIYLLNKKKMIGIMQGILVAIFIEVVHGGITLLISRPFTVALEIIKTAIPPMIIANGLGIAICIIIIHNSIPVNAEIPIVKK